MPLNTNIGTQNGYIGKFIYNATKGTTRFEPVCKEVDVVKRIKVLESKEYRLLLQWTDLGEVNQLEVSRKDLVKNKAGDLLKYGLDTYEHTMPTFLKYIQSVEQTLPTTLQHQYMGWMAYNQERIYKADKLITKTGSTLESTYCGDVAIGSKGDKDVYRQMLKNEVVGHIPMEVALVLGASSVVNAYLSKEVNDESLFFNLFNESSKGKSIAALLAVSTSSKPSIQGNTNVTTWLSTANYITTCLCNNYGMCFVIDEGSLISNKDISSIVYMLAGGEEKGRQKANLEKQTSRNWNTTIISTSEGSLMELVNQNGGIPNRLFEFGNITWTKDAQSADRVRKCIQENYGFLGKDIAKFLVNQDYSQVKKAFLQEVDLYLGAVSKNKHQEFIPRVAKKMGILLYTAEVINCIWEIGLDKDAILNFLINNVNRGQIEDLGERAIECILEEVTKHNQKFVKKIRSKALGINELIMPKGEVWGRINQKDIKPVSREKSKAKEQHQAEYAYREIILLPNVLKRFLQENGFTNVGVVLESLKQKGILHSEKGKNVRRREVVPGDGEVSTYVIIDKRNQLKLVEEKMEDEMKLLDNVNQIFDE